MDRQRQISRALFALSTNIDCVLLCNYEHVVIIYDRDQRLLHTRFRHGFSLGVACLIMTFCSPELPLLVKLSTGRHSTPPINTNNIGVAAFLARLGL